MFKIAKQKDEKLARKNKTYSKIITGLVLASCVFSTSSRVEIFAQGSIQEYKQEKENLNSQLNDLNKELDNLNAQLTSYNQRKNSLVEEKASINQVISETDALIESTKEAIKKIEQDIELKKKEIEILNGKISEIFVDIQAKDKSPVQILFSSGDIAATISEITSRASTNERLDDLKKESKKVEAELENIKQEKIKVKDQQEQIKALNNSKKDSLEILIAQTQNDEVKYQRLVAEESQNKMIIDDQIKDVDKKISEKEAEENKKKIEEELKRAQAEKERLAREAEAKRVAEEQAKNQQIVTNNNVEKPAVNEISTTPSISVGQVAYGNPKNEGYPCFTINEAKDVSGIGSDWVAPASGYITSGFGCGTGFDGAHDGIDIANGLGTPVYSIGNGIVVKSVFSGCVNSGCWDKGLGNYVVIQHNFGNRKVYSVYGHFYQAPLVSVGQTVSKGQKIGGIGSVGYSSGPHLHFAIVNETYNSMGSNCNRIYNWSYTASCFNPFEAPFRLY